MQIADILRHKGSSVVSVAPDDAITDLLARLAEHNVGALVVGDGTSVAGIVSERDVVRRLNDHGAPMLNGTVADIMTTTVTTCSTQDTVDDIAATMTERRIRHMPVVDNGHLVGVVSIGDVVRSRIEQLEQDRGQLENYITG